MKTEKAKRLAKAGWKLGNAKDFLGLDASEVEFMEIKLGLARRVRELRVQNSWTQADLAARLGSSQSRVAKMEADDSTVSMDLLVRSLLTAGADRKDVGARWNHDGGDSRPHYDARQCFRSCSFWR